MDWRSYFAPQLHIFGKRDNGSPHHTFKRFQNFCFSTLYPFSFRCRVDSYVDAPFPWLILFKQILLVSKSIIKLQSLTVLRCNFSFLILYFKFANFSLLMLYSVDCSKYNFVKDSVIFFEFLYHFQHYQIKQFPTVPKKCPYSEFFWCVFLRILTK